MIAILQPFFSKLRSRTIQVLRQIIPRMSIEKYLKTKEENEKKIMVFVYCYEAGLTQSGGAPIGAVDKLCYQRARG